MGFFESLLLFFVGKSAIKDVAKSTNTSSHIPPDSYFGTPANVKKYIKQVMQSINDAYINIELNDLLKDYGDVPFDLSEMSKPFFMHNSDSLLRILLLDDDNRRNFHKKFVASYSAPQSLSLKMSLIKAMLASMCNGKAGFESLLHNELLYIINEHYPKNNEEVMIQYLCRFIDAELYLLQGNYINSLKRFYQVLSWDNLMNYGQVYKARGTRDFDVFEENGLESLYEATIVNIINIYAVMGLSGKTDETRTVFKVFIADKCDSHYRNDFSVGPLAGIGSAAANAYTARNEMNGFYSIITDSLNDSDMFEDMYSCYNGSDHYLIPFTLFNKFYHIEESPTNPPALLMERFPYGQDVVYTLQIQNYKQAAREQKEEAEFLTGYN